MKTLKQIKENYDSLVNKEEANTELASLVRMGLLESNKLPMLKRSLEKDPSEMTIAEKKTLLDFANTLLETTLIKEATMADHLSKMDPSFSKQFTEKDLPTVIILKRKAVRVFPDKQKIALYYSQALDKYISIPFGPQTKSVGDISMQLSESLDKPHPFAKLDTSELPEPYQILVRKTVKGHESAGGKAYKGPKTKATKADVLRHLDTKAATKLPGGTIRSIGRDIATLGDQPGRLVGKIAGTLTLKGARMVKSGVKAAAKEIKSMVSEDNVELNEGALDYIPGYTASKEDMLRRAKQPLSQNLKDFAKSVPETVLSGIGAMKGAGAAVTAAKAGTKMISGMSKAGKAAGVASRVSKGGKITDPARLAKRKAIEKMLKNKRAGAGKVNGKQGFLSRLGSAIGGGGSGGGGSASPSTDAKEAGSRAVTPRTSYEFSGPGRFAGQLGSGKRVVADPNEIRAQRQAFGQSIYGKQIAEETSNFDKIKFIAENKLDGATIPYGDNSVTINNRVANKIMNVYESLNRTNKKKVEKMLNEDASSFKKVINFAIRQ